MLFSLGKDIRTELSATEGKQPQLIRQYSLQKHYVQLLFFRFVYKVFDK